MYSYVIEQWGITLVFCFFTYGYWVTPDGGYCVGTAMKSAKSGAQHNCSNQGSDSSEHVNNTTSGEVLSKTVKVWWTVPKIWGFFGGEGKFYYFLFYFFGENDRHLLHYIEQVHPEEIEAWYNSNCSLCILGIIKLCLLTWKIRFHFALGWELSYTKLYIERKMLNQEKNTLLA